MGMKWPDRQKLVSRFKKLAPSASKNLNEAGQRTAAEMVQLARALVPVRTGRLKDSIRVTGPGGSPPKYSTGALPRVPEDAYMVSVGDTDVRYGPMVEFGTKPHENQGTNPGTQHPGTRRQPFFWPAYRTIRKRHKGRVTRALSKAIRDTKN